MKFSLCFVLVFSLLVSCASTTQVIVPEGLSAQDLFQKGQELVEAGSFNEALAWFGAARERFADEPGVICQAEYEYANTLFKLGRYKESLDLTTQLLGRYEGPDAKLLPAQFKVLGDGLKKRLANKI